MTKKTWLLLLSLLGFLVAGELLYTRHQIAAGSSGEEMLDAWLLPFGTVLVLVGCVAFAKGRGLAVRLLAGFVVLFGLVVSALGYVLVTRW